MNQYDFEIFAKIIEYFQLELVECRNKFQGSCPIHPNSDSNSFVIFKNTKLYYCFTYHCEETFGRSVVGLVKGILSRNNGWCGPDDTNKIVSTSEALKFLASLGYTTERYTRDPIPSYISNFIKREKLKEKLIISKEINSDIIKDIVMPSKYYLTRGYDPTILTMYGVGDYFGSNLLLKNRAIVPIYSNNKFIGYTARIFYDKCLSCGMFHEEGNRCIRNNNEKLFYEKWIHSNDFKSRNNLYNIDNAYEYVLKNKHLIIVESPGNIWRLVESGIKNCVATFGTGLSLNQINLIMKIGLLNLSKITIIYDNDTAGHEASKKLKEKLPKYLQINNLCPPYTNDLGDMSIKEIKELLGEMND